MYRVALRQLFEGRSCLVWSGVKARGDPNIVSHIYSDFLQSEHVPPRSIEILFGEYLVTNITSYLISKSYFVKIKD